MLERSTEVSVIHTENQYTKSVMDKLLYRFQCFFIRADPRESMVFYDFFTADVCTDVFIFWLNLGARQWWRAWKCVIGVWWTFDDLEGMRCLFTFFFKREKKCICGAFQLDAAVPEKHLYFFLALSKESTIYYGTMLCHYLNMQGQPSSRTRCLDFGPYVIPSPYFACADKECTCGMSFFNVQPSNGALADP